MESEESKGVRWCISIDGSDISWQGFSTVLDNLRKDDDYIIVSHIYDDKKDYLAYNFKPDNVKQDCEAKLIGLHETKWCLVWVHKEKNMTVKEHITGVAEEYRSNILVLGFHGRKGPKEDPTLLGSNVDKIALEPVCPVLIMKREEKRADKESGGYRFLVCMDDRGKSVEALQTTLKIMDIEKDELIVMHVKSASIDADKIESTATGICDEANAKYQFVLHQKEFNEGVGHAIADYINIDDTPYIDFVAISNRGVPMSAFGSKDKHLGKVPKEVVMKSLANILLVA